MSEICTTSLHTKVFFLLCFFHSEDILYLQKVNCKKKKVKSKKKAINRCKKKCNKKKEKLRNLVCATVQQLVIPPLLNCYQMPFFFLSFFSPSFPQIFL